MHLLKAWAKLAKFIKGIPTSFERSVGIEMRGGGSHLMMRLNIKLYCTSDLLLRRLSSRESFCSGIGPTLAVTDLQAIVVLAILGVSAEALAHSAPSGATESIAYIPYVTMAVLVPSWTSHWPLAYLRLWIAASRIRWAKTIFNFSQASLSAGLAAIAFLLIGGKPLLACGAGTVGFSWLMLIAMFVASLAYVF